ncbi:asparagine synthase (glutamine-hydrolyzing) [Burkholderia ubonensis]|uniref:asparagine synthase (glutamine-hydrolyzing) n=1 Tax=Burkholderia ubonensis TaxID=101571 RepID=A0A1R1JIP3_9BURK|nr:asparagine synthase (glutamine-hydrolyzing) [Burkholderia ubonensis]OMG75140.1 asparagine synthase (glutamine-hydrolyzing) [Burkholderia ubonensis]
MCGIVGIFQDRDDRVLPARLGDAIQSLRHRGPDASGFWLAPDQSVALGHTRLSVMGPANGAQPIVAGDGRLVAVVNGEFYGFERIRAELIAAGARFTTDSDSEIVLHLYDRYGIRGIERLRGEFAILLYDHARRRLLAVRDRFGIKPLYYAHHRGNWYFASEVKALFAAGVAAEWDEYAYASRSFYLRDHTLYRDVRSVQPGTWVTIDSGGFHAGQYWDIAFPPSAELGPVDEAQAVDDVRAALEDAVSVRLRSDAPFGVYLSGGIDSSAVLGIATALSGRTLDAFHLTFPGMKGYDEREFANLAATHNDARLHVVEISQQVLADHFEQALWHNETPFFNAHGVAKFLLSRRTAAHRLKVVLTGEGADEIFGGYPHFRRDMLMYNADHQDGAVVADLLAKLRGSEQGYARAAMPADTVWMSRQLGHGVSWVDNQSGWFAALEALYRDAFGARMKGLEPYRQFYDGLDHRQLDGRDPVHRSMYLWSKSFLPNFVLATLGDRMEMAHGVEGRVPFLDHLLAERVNRLPVWMKIRGATEKHVFREAARPYLPDALYRRKKHYFRAPPATLALDGALYQLVFDTLHGTDLERLPFFEPGAVRRLLRQLPSRPGAERDLLDPMLMEMTSLCLLQKRFRLTQRIEPAAHAVELP